MLNRVLSQRQQLLATQRDSGYHINSHANQEKCCRRELADGKQEVGHLQGPKGYA